MHRRLLSLILGRFRVYAHASFLAAQRTYLSDRVIENQCDSLGGGTRTDELTDYFVGKVVSRCVLCD